MVPIDNTKCNIKFLTCQTIWKLFPQSVESKRRKKKQKYIKSQQDTYLKEKSFILITTSNNRLHLRVSCDKLILAFHRTNMNWRNPLLLTNSYKHTHLINTNYYERTTSFINYSKSYLQLKILKYLQLLELYIWYEEIIEYDIEANILILVRNRLC